MTSISHPVGVSPQAVAQWSPHLAGSPARHGDSALDVWLVTMPTTSADGTFGTQSFAIRARTAAQAIADAAVHAGSSQAVMHRRGARIRLQEANATPWTAFRL